MFLAILTLLSAAALLLAGPVKADAPAEMDGEQGAFSQRLDDIEKVERIMLNFAANAPRHPIHRADYRRKFSECIVEAATSEDLEVSWVAMIVQRESSFKTTVKRGKRYGKRGGEIGVMQVHPGTARKFECEMETVMGQLNCGCSVLRYGFDKCGNIQGALSVYASRSGTCNPKPGSKLYKVVEARMDLIRKMREM